MERVHMRARKCKGTIVDVISCEKKHNTDIINETINDKCYEFYYLENLYPTYFPEKYHEYDSMKSSCFCDEIYDYAIKVQYQYRGNDYQGILYLTLDRPILNMKKIWIFIDKKNPNKIIRFKI